MLELRIAPIFFNTMEDAGALPISMEDIGDPIDLISITLHRLEGKE
jgi:aconitase B